ncbi:methyltransferase domain-containing protein [Leptotrichia buccalis]|uniref:Methyltransferase n=1 Tax=Leptotrichia buccalis (strain ATCC 14201 / DSM 1135 / JCM 12969 / NCTC 10249 / C-1013-b) TaxID=523794 RepID=C7NAF0_LEPBD|nr:methyltransferase domain-containing protein [Leptotrichia buccalis]ACV39131.1 methyltransferase [Leptotrichia buccalis C-1013-b]
MKKFIEDNYLEDIRKKIPAYDLMLEIIFNAVLQVEMKTLKIKNVLSIGGQSFEVKKLSKICKNSEITLIEPSEIMINIVKNECNNLKNLEYICDKFENYTNNKNFQLCLCLLVLQFVDNSKKFLEKIYKSLDKNGVFIISVFSNKQLNYWKEFALARGARKEQVKKTFRNQSEVMNVLPADYVENLLKEIGFSKIEKVCEVLSVSMWAVRK